MFNPPKAYPKGYTLKADVVYDIDGQLVAKYDGPVWDIVDEDNFQNPSFRFGTTWLFDIEEDGDEQALVMLVESPADNVVGLLNCDGAKILRYETPETVLKWIKELRLVDMEQRTDLR